ncbi:unnamed protein product [Paramecium sonneborni]|uniref:Uncharacterized protein n=1 Tax=Paramecium sonneborni TaxID=65129 RepID=A0A8S1MPS6_9CILI|nr:unnamed protein product [Paramecium sonneborni]
MNILLFVIQGYAYKINRTSLVERMFEQQGDNLKLHRIELLQLAKLKTETDLKTSSIYPQYYCKRFKTEVPEVNSQEIIPQSMTTAKKNLLYYQNKKKQRKNQIKQQMDLMSQNLENNQPKYHMRYCLILNLSSFLKLIDAIIQYNIQNNICCNHNKPNDNNY